MNIVVLCGGLSPERNVSISSSTKVSAALRSLGHKVVMVDMFFGFENYAGDLNNIFDNPPEIGVTSIDEAAPDLEQIKKSRKIEMPGEFGYGVLDVCAKADIVFMGLHGQCGEDGKVQAVFDLLGIRYTGSGFLSSAVAMDKDFTKRVVAPTGVKTPAWNTYDSKSITSSEVLSQMNLPLVVKPDNSGSSIGVSIAHDKNELDEALKSARNESKKIIIEEYVSGREIQVAILDGKALPSIEICPLQGFYDYKNKYQPGAAKEITPSPIPEEAETRVRAAAEKIFACIGLSVYSRADFIYDENGDFWFLEINTLPGMTPTSLVPQEAEAAGISYGELCSKIVELSMEKYR